MGRAQHGRLVEISTGDLNPDGQSIVEETGADRDGGMAGDVERNVDHREGEIGKDVLGREPGLGDQQTGGQQEVVVGEDVLHLARQLAAAALGLDVVDRADQPAERDPAAQQPAILVEPFGDHFLVDRQRLGGKDHPAGRVIVHHVGDPDRLHCRTQPAHRLGRRVHRGHDLGMGIEVFGVEMADQADTEAGKASVEHAPIVVDRLLAARRVDRVVTGDRLQHQRAVLGRPCHRAHRIEREGERDIALGAYPAEGRLQAGDPAMRGR